MADIPSDALGEWYLRSKCVAANASYGHGVGAETSLSKEHAMTIAVFTEEPLRKYYATE